MKLKPCPFCGFPPFTVERKCEATKFGVGCSNPECIIFLPSDVKKRYLHNYVWVYADKKIMAAAWNQRP